MLNAETKFGVLDLASCVSGPRCQTPNPRTQNETPRRPAPPGFNQQALGLPRILVPKFKTIPTSVERELRTGGMLYERLRRERALTPLRMEQAALPHKNYQRRPGSELDLQAVVDARTWMRWKLTDPYFWHDKKNIKRFVKDNPIAAPWKT